MNVLAVALLFASIFQYTNCADEISQLQCGKSVGCFRLPADCKTTSCNVFITYAYKPSTDSFDISIFTKHKWGAFAQGKELNKEIMTGMKGEACVEKNGIVQLVSLSATKNGLPDFKATTSAIFNPTGMKTKGGIICKYSRKAGVKDIKDFMTSLETKVYSIYAFGDTLQTNGYPAYHGAGHTGHTVEATDLKKVMLS
nr:uncharacterized protein LOC101239233 [Hydra vulgaris]